MLVTFQLADEIISLVARELAGRLTLSESHRPPSITEAIVSRREQQLEQPIDLPP